MRSSTENYEALSEVYGLIYKITRGGMTLEMADLKLNQITHRPKPFPPLVVWLANLACAGTLTAALGASFATALSAAIIFIPVYLLIQWLSSIGIPAFFRMAASAGLMTFLAIWLGGEDPFFRCCSVRGGDFGASGGGCGHDYVLADSASGGCRAGCD